MSDYLTIEDLVRIYGVDKNTVRRWCQKGEIQAKKIGKKWFIPKDGHIREEQEATK